MEEKSLKEKAIDKRKLYDKIATGIVTTGGIAIIGSIIAILVFIGIVAVPLWESPDYHLEKTLNIYNSESDTDEQSELLVLGTDEYRELAFLIFDNGEIKIISLADGSVVEKISIDKEEVTASYIGRNNRSFAVATKDGEIYPISVDYNISFSDELERKVTPEVEIGKPVRLKEKGIKKLGFSANNSGNSFSAGIYYGDGELFYYGEEKEETLFGEGEVTTYETDLSGYLKGREIEDIEIDDAQNYMYVSTADGKILEWDIRDKAEPHLRGIHDVSQKNDFAVTSLGFLIGDRSLTVGDSEGNISVWFHARDQETGERKLTKVHTFPSMDSEVTHFSQSSRDRGFIASDIEGNISLYYATTERRRFEIPENNHLYKSITFAPKADAIIAVDETGNLFNWSVNNPHPETTLKTLFGKVWYEGYDEPEYVWQSTGGDDSFEPKLSITPLAYGTLKGAIYALIFAIPLAVLSAICISQFVHPNIRNVIKPVIEIMAALPSVILGFFAGLWMAPMLEKYFPSIILIPVLITFFTFVFLFVWKIIPARYTGRVKTGGELFFLIPAVIISIVIALSFNFHAELLMFGGDYKSWFYSTMGLGYDQRNALIVGFAMGFAVIPIIFTISEDALSSVPKNLTAGSLALGANRWQTATQIVLPSASPGIFSAIMIGLGRAVGETMIVLMATGNTPIMDWSFFNGFRAMSANIAVELPEAPHEGTLYRVIFLTAVLLFLFTFVINTAAEIVRQRLRKKYGQL